LDDLLEPKAIAYGDRVFLVIAALNIEVAQDALHLRELDGPLEQSVQVDPLFGRAAAAQVQHFPNNARRAFSFLDHPLDVSRHLGVEVSLREDQLTEPDDSRQGVVDLMRDPGREGSDGGEALCAKQVLSEPGGLASAPLSLSPASFGGQRAQDELVGVAGLIDPLARSSGDEGFEATGAEPSREEVDLRQSERGAGLGLRIRHQQHLRARVNALHV